MAVAGVPENSGSLEARFRPFADWSINAFWRYVGEYEVDALNTVQAESYDLLDLGVSYTNRGERNYAFMHGSTTLRTRSTPRRSRSSAVSSCSLQGTVRAGIQFDFQ